MSKMVKSQRRTVISSIFTLDIGGVPTLTFEAKNLRQSWELCHEEWLREDIMRLKSNGVPLWDGKASLSTRYATQPEREIYLEAANEPAAGELLLTYLDLMQDLYLKFARNSGHMPFLLPPTPYGLLKANPDCPTASPHTDQSRRSVSVTSQSQRPVDSALFL